MRKMLGIIAAIVAVMVMALPLAACGNSSAGKSEDDLKDIIAELIDKNEELTNKVDDLTDKVDDLTTENGTLSDKVDDLTAENGELTDKINALNVFTTDKAEYNERETMTIYFKNVPVLKIRLRFDTPDGTPLSGGSCAMYITSLCADIYAESILSTMFLVWDNGIILKNNSTSTNVLKKNIETRTGGYFADTQDAYDNGTWFDIAICVPGTPFELARFKNVSHTK